MSDFLYIKKTPQGERRLYDADVVDGLLRRLFAGAVDRAEGFEEAAKRKVGIEEDGAMASVMISLSSARAVAWREAAREVRELAIETLKLDVSEVSRETSEAEALPPPPA